MSRNLDSSMAAALPNGLIQPFFLVELTLKSGTEYVWSGVGDLVYGGNTYQGVGNLGSVGVITEDSSVKADGTTVTLSGIGISNIPIPALGVTPPDPPRATVPGESVAWALPTTASGTSGFSAHHDLPSPGVDISGSTDILSNSGSLSLTGGYPFDPNSVVAEWSGFRLPLEIPSGAKITGVYPVAVVSSLASGAYIGIIATPGDEGIGSPLAVGTNAGADLGALDGNGIQAEILSTVAADGPSAYLAISFVGMAVYYLGSPLTNVSFLNEALGDIQIGAPAKIRFGLMTGGTIIGAPYLIFSGTVDKPSIRVSDKTSSITLALENRLVNLRRATQRRYTAADQQLQYPTDRSFNWVEILNDIALRWGG
jgi:hypothetical protein